MRYKMVATDLDGTLLDETGRLSKENLKALETLTQIGVLVVPASGRALEEMPKEIQDCPYFRYYIASNGAAIYDKESGFMQEWSFSREQGKKILDLLTSCDTISLIHIGTKTYMEESTHDPACYASFNMNATWQSYCMSYLVPIPGQLAFAYAQESIQSFTTFFRHKEELKAVWQVLSKDSSISLAQTDPFNIEIFSSLAGKGTALLHLANHLGIDRNATIALGDSTNDLSMLKAAGLGLAVENAVPKAKKTADGVICHHNDHCLKYLLEHYYV